MRIFLRYWDDMFFLSVEICFMRDVIMDIAIISFALALERSVVRTVLVVVTVVTVARS